MDKRIALFAVALLSARVWAEDLPELQETVVTATRAPTDLLQSPSFVTVITQKDIEASGAADLSGVLSQQSGVVVNDYGPQGQGKTVSIRGSTSSQVLVMVDGIRLNSSFDGYVDLSRIPVDSIDHIEIVRGSAGSLWGTGAVGGVINIITKKPDRPQLSLSVTNGSYIPHDAWAVTSTGQSFIPATAMSLFDNQKVSLSAAGSLGAVGLTGGGSFTRAMNAFLWDDTLNLGAWRQRNNAQDLAEDAFAGVELPLLQGSLSAKSSFDHSLIGAPGSLTFVSSQATQEDTTAMGSLAYRADRFFSDRLTFDAKGSYRYAQEIYDNPLFPPESIHATNAFSLDLTQKLALADVISAVYGGNGSYETVDSTNLSGTNDRLTLAGFLSLPFSPVQILTITPSVRYDSYSDFPGFLAFQLGAVLNLSDVSSLRASLGSAYRVPTLSDLYWTDPYGDTGNPNLKPETAYSGDVGWTFQDKGVSLETDVFARLMFNQIEWVYNSTTFTTYVINVTQSFLPGFELHGKVGLTDRFSLQADYAFIYSFLIQYPGFSYQLSDDQRVPWVPVHNLTLALTYQDAQSTASVESQYMSAKTYFDSGSSSWATLAGYVILNAGYRLQAASSLAFSVRLLNILDTLYYTEAGYPMPPFSIVTGVEAKL
ncbi:MAG TPA: TonB-dependent receptor [Spirochaetia bacterium]|nr:TonB-dependent receptor [Spirochaetia bacterium]